MAELPQGGKITAILPQKKRRNRVSIYIDGRFAFGLDQDIAERSELQNGQLLQQSQIKEILEDEEYKRALEKAYRLLAARPRSKYEISKRLSEKQYPTFIIKRVLEKCESLGYLDDREFARQFARTRLLRRPAGRRVLEQELRQRGIADPVIAAVMNEVYEEATETELACALVKRRMKSLKDLPVDRAKRRLVSFLQTRGFTWDVIEQAINDTADFEGD